MGLDMYLTTNSRPLAKAVYDKANSKLAEIDDTGYREPDWRVKFFYQASW